MTPEFTKKLVRLFVGIVLFTSLFSISGMESRKVQMIVMSLGGFCVFGLMMRNIWLTLFMWWTVFLFAFFRFTSGQLYISNIIAGCMLYYVTKYAFRKEHLDWFVKIFLILVGMNVVYMVFQMTGNDFIYRMIIHSTGEAVKSNDPAGFMGLKAAMGMLMAFGVPIVASRSTKWAIPGALFLFIPLYLSQSSVAVGSGIVGLLFVLWWKSNRRIWWCTLISLCVLGACYVIFVDYPMGNSFTQRIIQWNMTLHDATIHPIVGWGLDSFRNQTPYKQHLYMMTTGTPNNLDYWDNTHNLYIQMFFEWGIVGLILLGGYVRQVGKWFRNATKDENTLGLVGFFIVFLLLSFAQFPIFLARTACFIIPGIALMEISLREE